jgi:transcriptional regulator with XRE-family HTH domain
VQERIISRMREIAMDQAELTEVSGLFPSFVCMILQGTRGKSMGVKTALKLCHALRVNIDFLYPEYPQKRIRDASGSRAS